ncbi:glutamate/gamma-aminobutyrate family transporter YjeM [Clostridium lacusfryxellense]|uniref:glutamate/gamma-aminobutyrate family transporter YjeM n=1 Tax=Clostridium lacusfryxellense TaxID=205328 RepID=UPI001C0BBE7B|nr:glutamate/gamma-aminobutyrate family transporter YjeM [Clostridium lacusfryxellense]MBU3113256.1 glutamate/gamma-aminobutyrate family transporter YjeM [Clostridium lacusfryxellense]
MSEKIIKAKHLTLVSLVLMIFTSVYGFNNIPRSFYKMGYAAIPWFIISGITFFIPFAFMMAEFGAAFKNEKGGIYSWMEKSVGAKFAFMGTFMWYSSYIVWMVNVASGVWVPISNALFGKDTTQAWALFGFTGLTGPKTLGILGIIWIIFVTFISTKGLEKIKKVTSLGGTAVAALNIVLLIGAILVLIGNHGQLAQPVIGLSSFTTSPNPAYTGNIISSFAFIVFALFAYGGIEVVGGLVDETENAEKTFPKGVVISAVVISIGYSLGIFLVGIFTNWQNVMNDKSVHLGNAGYVVMGNLGYALGQAFGANEATSLAMAHGISRFVGISMFLALAGAFFTLMFSPLKQIIEGTPAKLWPGRLAEMKNGMPQYAMWIQAAIVCIMIALISFGGETMSGFFDVLVAMTNVAMTLPYLFIAYAFIPFKKNKDIVKPFEMFKTDSSAVIWTVVVMFTVGFANFFSIIQPALEGNLSITIWSVAGPIFFAFVAWLMYWMYERKYTNI